MNRKELAVLSLLTIAIAFMDISGLPGALISYTVADVAPPVLPLIFNFVLIGLLAFAVLKAFPIPLRLGLSRKGLLSGLKKYALPGIFAGLCSFAAFYVGLRPFDYQPTVWKILLEGIAYYIGVGLIEEFYVRGLFLNIIEALCHQSPQKTDLAIIISSVVFGLGHVPGVIGMGVGVAAFKVVSTIGMGPYFGTIYKSTNNLWVPAVMHIFIDICALPYCFTTKSIYPSISIVILLITYLLLGIYSFLLMKSAKRR